MAVVPKLRRSNRRPMLGNSGVSECWAILNSTIVLHITYSYSHTHSTMILDATPLGL